MLRGDLVRVLHDVGVGTVDRHVVAAQRDVVARRFAGVGWKAPALLGAMRAASDFRFDSISQVRLARV